MKDILRFLLCWALPRVGGLFLFQSYKRNFVLLHLLHMEYVSGVTRLRSQCGQVGRGVATGVYRHIYPPNQSTLNVLCGCFVSLTHLYPHKSNSWLRPCRWAQIQWRNLGLGKGAWRAYNVGPEAEPPAGSRDRVPGNGVRELSPLKLKHSFWAFNWSGKFKFGNAENHRCMLSRRRGKHHTMPEVRHCTAEWHHICTVHLEVCCQVRLPSPSPP